MTQEQANAIAERKFPTTPDTTTTGRTLTIVQREVYAQCLMDMEPVFEVGDKMALSCDYGLCIAWDTATAQFDPK